jgi:signal transduction histidine kinase/DNA-binding response OmpR family regulator/predicted negative regulator of RcsB-dependent stress response
MTRWCSIIVYIILPGIGIAQPDALKHRYDSLYRQLRLTSSDTTAIKCYHMLAELISQSDPGKALIYEDSALQIARKLKSPKHIAMTFTNIGSHYRHLSEYPRAYENFREAIKASPPLSAWLGDTYLEAGIVLLRLSRLDSATYYATAGLDLVDRYPDAYLEASFFNLLGNIKRQENKYEEALDNYIKSAKIFEEHHLPRGLTQALSNVGNIQNLLGHTDKALEYALQSLETAKSINLQSSIAYSQRLLGRIYRKQGKSEEALRAYKEALTIYRSIGEKRECGETQSSIGNLYFDMGKFDFAVAEYRSALGAFRTIGDPLNISYVYLSTGNTYMMLKQYNLTRAYIDSALQLARENKIPAVEMDSYAVLSEMNGALGDYKISKEYYERYIHIRDSVTVVQNRKAAEEIEARYESEKKDDEIRILNAENELKATQIESKNRERNYLLAFLLLTVSLAGIVYNRYTVKLKANRKLKELDQMKSRFFTNVSHEFRTPLSLILGPLEEKLRTTTDSAERESLKLMHRNATRLQNLINQLLDLSKLEAGNMELQLQEAELSSFIRLISSTFSSLSHRKNLTYKQEIFEGPVMACFDRDKVEKMINNLLSNAFKFTNEGGFVSMKASVDDGILTVEVKDSGVGIPESKLGLIFNRFYQVDDSITRSAEGSGIGLALTKELAELHRGKISVTSREGIGTVFTLSLPVNRESFSDLDVIAQPTDGQQPVFNAPGIEQYHHDTDESKPLVLVAEDNDDMQRFIYDLLKDRYRVECVSNGMQAYELSKALVPDLVITDWMMPVMDGRECCEKLKITDATSHIPVLMLTARADQSSKLEGLETGADEYLVKPFDTNELSVRVSNLIEQRKKLREIFSKELVLQPRNVSLPSRDAMFLTKLLELLENKYSDPDFSVEELAGDVNMSRMQLHRKTKALTDQSPGEFLRRFRLERAKQLLSVPGTQVSEVCFQVGFNNVSHFSKAFKDFTGITPTEFIEAQGVKAKML